MRTPSTLRLSHHDAKSSLGNKVTTREYICTQLVKLIFPRHGEMRSTDLNAAPAHGTLFFLISSQRTISYIVARNTIRGN